MSGERAIFLRAIELESAAEQAEFLDSACANQPELRRAVDQLLLAHGLPDNPLDSAIAVASDADHRRAFADARGLPVEAGVGTSIGPYRLMELIGEGGFGQVYVAQQTVPLRRKVALKIIKPGMDSREVVARFEVERQALAQMDHPHIASVIDAGATDGGRPYFVMELVKGMPITEYCQGHDVSLRERLRLLIDVCNALHHAHQKGIIHRDIKPSNVMVTVLDGRAVIKVIDFGVAKAIASGLTERTIYTRFAAIMGTPLYMSPEQAALSAVDVDTRSDIYGLGVLMYELLTGHTPFENARFRAVEFDEMRRIIREEIPPRPSTRLSTVGQVSTGSPGPKPYDSKRLAMSIRGDLDWIVMKALEKERQRRYNSAAAMAEDIRSHLDGRPVRARPPSPWYLANKFIKRHRGVFAAAVAILLILVASTAFSLWQAAQAVRERNQKQLALQKAVRLQQEADESRRAVETFAERLKRANALVTSGRIHADAGRHLEALAELTQAIAEQPNHYAAWVERASLFVKLGLWDRAASDYTKSLEAGVPADSPASWGVPQLLLWTGDRQGYRDLCQTLYQQAEGQPSLSLLRSCLLGVHPTIPAGRLEELARAMESRGLQRGGPTARSLRQPRRPGPPPGGPPHLRDPDHSGSTVPGGTVPGGTVPGGTVPGVTGPPLNRPDFSMPPGVHMYVAGLAYFRCGRYQESVDSLMRSRGERWPGGSLTEPVLAMAFFQLGDADAASASLQRADRDLENWITQFLADQQKPRMPWFDYVEFRILHREAHQLIDGSIPPEDPRLQRFRQQRLTELNLASPETE